MCPQPYSTIRKERALKTNSRAPLVTHTATTTRCLGAYRLDQACSRSRAKRLTSAPPRTVAGDILAIPVNRTWSSLQDEFSDGPNVSIDGEEIEFVPAQLNLLDDSVNARLLGRYCVLDSDVLVVEGEIVLDDMRHIRLEGPHVLVLDPAA